MKREVISLPPKTKVNVDESFYSTASIHLRRTADARAGVKCGLIKEAHVIQPAEWGNIWVYGLEIFLAGFHSYEEFGQRAAALMPNSKVFQYEHTSVKNLSLPVSSLKPMHKLF